jgi:hypothetical protein
MPVVCTENSKSNLAKFHFPPVFHLLTGIRVTFLPELLVLVSVVARNIEMAAWCWFLFAFSSDKGFSSKAPLVKPLATWWITALSIND